MKKFLRKLSSLFRSIFGKEFEFLKKYSGIAVKVTAELKKYVESDILKVAVNVIPGSVDDDILFKLQKIVPVVAAQMAITHKIIQESEKHSDMITAIAEYLRSMNKDARAGFWIEFTARLNMALVDGKLSFPEAVSLSQLVYAEIKGGV